MTSALISTSYASAPQYYQNLPFPEPAIDDCYRAVAVVAGDLQYNLKQTCLVLLDGEFGDATDVFALSDLMPAIALTEQICVRKRPAGQKNGGFAMVGSNKGFYIVVQYNPDFDDTSHFAKNSNLTASIGPQRQSNNVANSNIATV
ncbi:hypothetical protein MMC28_009537 [Mycoblastus sanguinarius]|nr:hypothetical protein [Mycoblastus sanguinarius]